MHRREEARQLVAAWADLKGPNRFSRPALMRRGAYFTISSPMR
jgi:hypothetical protein